MTYNNLRAEVSALGFDTELEIGNALSSATSLPSHTKHAFGKRKCEIQARTCKSGKEKDFGNAIQTFADHDLYDRYCIDNVERQSRYEFRRYSRRTTETLSIIYSRIPRLLARIRL